MTAPVPDLVIADWLLFSSTGTYCKLKFKKRMAESEVRRCLDWLEQKKAEFEQTGFGDNHRTVTEASHQHATSRAKILEYRKQMDKLANKQTLTDAELQAMYGAYGALETLADKKSGCLEMIKGIASLEDHIQGLSTEFDSRTVHMVNVLQNNKRNNGKGLDNDALAKATQSCMSAVRQSWRWLDEVMQCAHVHLSNASTYHQFFHDVEETDYFMNSTLANMHMTFRRQNLSGDRADLNDMNREIKDTLMAYLRWQSKVDNLMSRVRDIVPVHKRTLPCKNPQLVLALASYKTDELEFEEGETLTLLDNTNKTNWKVKNGKDQTGLVPAVLLLISGPTGEALDAAVRLRLQLLGLWTTSVKRLGFQMIAFMQLVFRDWSDEEVAAIQQMSKPDRAELQRILQHVDTTLQTHWQGYQGFDELQERIARLRTILDEADSAKAKGGEVPGEIVVQVKMLENLLSGYQDFWTYWETYKVATEMSRQPKYILVCDRWDQLRFTSSAHYVRFWDTSLSIPQEGGKQYKAEATLTIHETPRNSSTAKGWHMKTEVGEGSQPVMEEINKSQIEKKGVIFPEDFVECKESSESFAVNTMTTTGMDEDEEWRTSTDITDTRQRQETTMDEVRTSTEEVQTVFVIKKVFHPKTQVVMSLEEAVVAGIIDQAEGKFNNIDTGESYTLQQAMANGDIVVEFKSQKTVRQEKSSYGLVTITSSKETRPYSIQSVIEPKTETEMTVEEATRKGILDVDMDKYITDTGEILSIIDAIQSGLIKATFHGKPEDSSDVSKTYAVNAVVDQKRMIKVSFSDALRRGLFDSEDGMYVNNVTRERMPFTDAVIKGFIKARVVTDTSSLDIDPSNRIVVERLASAQQKIIKQVRVAKAFQAGRHFNGQ